MRDTFEMAKEAGFMQHLGVICIPNAPTLERFAELVRADEREACAKVCDELAGILACHNDKDGSEICASLRDTIRARGNT